MNRKDYLYEDYSNKKVNITVEEPKEETYEDKFINILPIKGLRGATKTNYEKLIDFGKCINSFDRYKKIDWFKHECNVDEFPSDGKKFLKKVCDDYFKAFKKYIDSGVFKSPKNDIYKKFSTETITIMNKVLPKLSYSLCTVDDLDKIYGRFVKNYDKLKPELEAEKKAAEEEAYKALHPDYYNKIAVFDPNALRNHVSVCKGENSFISQALTKRARLYHFAQSFKNGEKYVFIKQCLDEIFCACDNAFFSAAYNGEKLDFNEAIDIENSWRERSKEEKMGICTYFDKMASTNFAVGGSCGLWSYRDVLTKALKSREKVTGADDREALYREWSISIDVILNEEGVPSLTAFLTNWVNDLVSYYKSESNINNWSSLIKSYTEELTSIKEITKNWGYSKLRNSDENRRIKELNKHISDVNYYLQLSKMPTEKLTEAFEKQAAEIRREFITKVCEVTGKVIDGYFRWGSGGKLNGYVKGEKCNASVNSFFAGGYNIQCLHVRTRITPEKN